MLLGNYSVLNKNPGRALGGSTVADTRASWSKRGPMQGRFTALSQKAALPNGHLAPSAWILPVEGGGMSTYTIILGTGAVGSSNLAGGKNAEAALSGSGSLSGTGALIVSAVAALTGSGTITSAAAVAYLNASATLAGSGDLAGAATAIGHAVAALAGSGSASPTISALGELTADVTPFTELSPATLAAAVWSSAEGAFLYAVAHHRVVTDPVAGTFTVYDTDDTTVLYVADLWADAAGTTPYSGSGAERRDRVT